MAWETRGNGLYYYRKERIGDRVFSRYVGAGPVAELIAEHDDLQRMEREAEAEAFQQECDTDLAIDRELNEVSAAVRAALAAALLLTGHHTHKRQWRKMRI